MKTLAQVFSGIVKPYIDAEDEKVLTNMAPVEESPATAAHVVGAQIIYNDVLYEVIDAIAIDDPLVIYPTTGANIKAADDITTQIKNHTVTTDATPTENSTNPVQSGGVFTSEQNIYAVMGRNGAKNLIPLEFVKDSDINQGTWSGNVYSNNGIDYTYDTDTGKVVANGTATDLSTFYFAVRSISGKRINLKAGKYTLTGCPEGGSTATYMVYLNTRYQSDNTNDGGMTDEGAGDTKTYASDMWASVYISIAAGTTVSNLEFAPMLRLADDTDETYQPFAKTNKQLTDEQGYITEAQYTAIQSLLNS